MLSRCDGIKMKIFVVPFLLFLVTQTGSGEKLKVFISVDMEGITGLVSSDQVSRGGSDYQMARRWMTAKR